MAKSNDQLSEEKKALGVVVKENPFFPNGKNEQTVTQSKLNDQDYDRDMFQSKQEEYDYWTAESKKHEDDYLEIGDSCQYPGGHI